MHIISLERRQGIRRKMNKATLCPSKNLQNSTPLLAAAFLAFCFQQHDNNSREEKSSIWVFAIFQFLAEEYISFCPIFHGSDKSVIKLEHHTTVCEDDNSFNRLLKNGVRSSAWEIKKEG